MPPNKEAQTSPRRRPRPEVRGRPGPGRKGRQRGGRGGRGSRPGEWRQPADAHGEGARRWGREGTVQGAPGRALGHTAPAAQRRKREYATWLFHRDKSCYFPSTQREGDIDHDLLRAVYDDTENLKYEIEKKKKYANKRIIIGLLPERRSFLSFFASRSPALLQQDRCPRGVGPGLRMWGAGKVLIGPARGTRDAGRRARGQGRHVAAALTGTTTVWVPGAPGRESGLHPEMCPCLLPVPGKVWEHPS